MKTNSNQPIKTAIVAFGLSGKALHAPLITNNPAFELVKVVERHAAESVKLYPQVKVCRSLDEVLEDPEVELVVITTPNVFHHTMARQSLEAGKHVVLEKPFTVTAEEARDLIELAKRQKKMLTAFQIRRWDGDFLTVQDLIQKEVLGSLAEFESNYDRYRPSLKGSWKEEAEPGGGIFYDLAPHLIDQALVLFGKPLSLFADIRKERPTAKVDDAFDLLLDYGKFKVNLRAGMLARLERPRYIIKGTGGSFRKIGMDPQEPVLRAGGAIGGEGWGQEEENSWGELYTNWKGLTFKGKLETRAGDYRGFYQNIAAHLRQGAELAVQPEEALLVMEVLEQAMQSAKEGKKLSFFSTVE